MLSSNKKPAFQRGSFGSSFSILSVSFRTSLRYSALRTLVAVSSSNRVTMNCNELLSRTTSRYSPSFSRLVNSVLAKVASNTGDLWLGLRSCFNTIAARLRYSRGKAKALKLGHYHRMYPLAEQFPTTKLEIMEFWSNHHFDLGLEEHEGNCRFCWKKSLRKHGILARESPEVFAFPARMEKLYPLHGYNEDGTPRVFFRGNLSTEELLRTVLSNPTEDLPSLVGPTCSESCEAFA